eukprot:gnl/Dysnectes_brevis/2976_a3667_758.p1 GENE.gnl/Dysnectes_brevis/2976_a3667_758~~gnl/Dysnectes_brevis/2976_a3667_758.p1  ORF type:complete len:637 (-),score=196.20 gnl/Dysnectes_brevis/2976_a3667_758:124-1995(-)
MAHQATDEEIPGNSFSPTTLQSIERKKSFETSKTVSKTLITAEEYDLYMQSLPALRVSVIIFLFFPISFLCLMDMSIVSILSESISHSIDGRQELSAWYTSAYSLALASFSFSAGSITSFLGIKKTYLISLCGFILTSLFCASSNSDYTLIISRVVQGMSAAFCLTSAWTLSLSLTDNKEARITTTVMSTAALLGMAVGSPVGGLLSSGENTWRWVFIINTVAIVPLVPAFWLLPHTPRLVSPDTLDWKSPLLAFMGIFCILLGFTAMSDSASESLVYNPIINIIEGVLLLGAGAMFFRWTWRVISVHPRPSMSPAMWANKQERHALFAAIPNASLLTICFYFVPYQLIRIDPATRSYDNADLGVLGIVCPLSLLLCAVFVQMWQKQASPTTVRLMALVMCVLGILMIGLRLSSIVSTYMGVAILSIGVAHFVSANNIFLLLVAPPSHRPALGGMQQTMREAGYAVGTQLTTFLMDLSLNIYLPDDIDPADYFPGDPDIIDKSAMLTCLLLLLCPIVSAVLVITAGYASDDKEVTLNCYPRACKHQAPIPTPSTASAGSGSGGSGAGAGNRRDPLFKQHVDISSSEDDLHWQDPLLSEIETDPYGNETKASIDPNANPLVPWL